MLFLHRQIYDERTAFAFFTLHFDFTFVQGDDFLHVAKSQAIALDVVYVTFRHAVEIFENVCDRFLWNTNALVGNGQQELFAVGLCVDENLRRALRVLDGVFQQVGDDILQVRAVTENLVLVRVEGKVQCPVDG